MIGGSLHGSVLYLITLEQKIKNKHKLWKQYTETRSEACLRKYRNSRLIHKAEQYEVAKAAKTNPKNFSDLC